MPLFSCLIRDTISITTYHLQPVSQGCINPFRWLLRVPPGLTFRNSAFFSQMATLKFLACIVLAHTYVRSICVQGFPHLRCAKLQDVILSVILSQNFCTCISRQPFPVKISIDQKQLENVESFKYLGIMLTNGGRCTCEIKCRIAMAKAAFKKKRTLFTSTLDLKSRTKLVKCYIWNIAFHCAETGCFGQRHLESLKCGAGEGWRDGEDQLG